MNGWLVPYWVDGCLVASWLDGVVEWMGRWMGI